MTGPSSATSNATSNATSVSPYESFTKVCLNQFEARLEDESYAREERPRATKPRPRPVRPSKETGEGGAPMDLGMVDMYLRTLPNVALDRTDEAEPRDTAKTFKASSSKSRKPQDSATRSIIHKEAEEFEKDSLSDVGVERVGDEACGEPPVTTTKKKRAKGGKKKDALTKLREEIKSNRTTAPKQAARVLVSVVDRSCLMTYER